VARTLTLEEAAALVESRDALGVPLGPGQPSALLHALGERESFDDLVVHSALLVDLYPLFTRPGVRLRSGFFGPAERVLADAGNAIEFVPADFRRFSIVAQRANPRIVASAATPADADGYLSLSLHAGATVDELHRAGRDPERLLIIEANSRLPRTCGLPPDAPHTIHVDEVDVIVEVDRDPFVLPDIEPTDEDRAIAQHASAYVHDGCTIQTGIGGIPSMVAKLLAEGPGGDYGIHSEMFTTGLMHLHQAGKVSNRRKGEFEGYSVTTFAAGSRELYDWLDDNDEVRFLPVDVVNAPDLIAKNHEIITVNGALAVDMFGQIMADTIGARQYSGIGGHEDFIAAAGLELEDRSLICLPSTAGVDDSRKSRIVPTFPVGSVITTPRHQVDVVITEFGVAELQGRTVRQRVDLLAELCHPDFRADFRAQADTYLAP
jgi:acyl-CoA hydrolase